MNITKELVNPNPQYQCGDTCKGECSGEVDGNMDCPRATIIEIDDDCNIMYVDRRVETCPHRPKYTFDDCAPGYGPGRGCAKWDHYHLMGRRF